MKNNKFLLVVTVFILGLPCFLWAQIDLAYQEPPDEILKLVDAPLTPSTLISPDGKWMVLLGRPSMPSIGEVSQPELRLGGLRINPAINSRSQSGFNNSISFLRVEDKKEFTVSGLPEIVKITSTSWSPDGQKLAFTLAKNEGIQLWRIDLNTMEAKALTKPVVNDIMYGSAYLWLPASDGIIFKSVDESRGKLTEKPTTPTGPVISENTGKVAAVWTYQDLLQNTYDEEVFDYYLMTQLKLVNLDNSQTNLGEAGIIGDFSLSPNGKYIMVQLVQGPYSYIVPYYYFPSKTEIWDIEGNVIKTVADLPLADDIPKGHGSVRTGPRSIQWRADVPATLYWVEALDEGDANKEVDFRDQLFCLKEPFDGNPEEVLKYGLRYGGISWGTGDRAITFEYWRRTRQEITILFQPDHPEKGKKVLFDRSTEDIYSDPGSFRSERNESGKYVLQTTDKGKALILVGRGASPEGNKPFVDKYFPENKKTIRLWQSKAPYYEFPVHVSDLEKGKIITLRESRTEQPNYFIRDLKNDKLDQITNFPHPHPEFSNLNKQLLKYYREDGVLLNGTLYLPYQEAEKNKDLPVILWAYPREFKSADAAGQVSDSPYQFDRISHWSPLIWLSMGYAVMDDPKMPIIGEGDEQPNDSFVDQLVMSAKAAVDTLVTMGVADPGKFVIGGHSYGAFMTANLLAHSDLFATGIARSGAYNRTLTPFGFQAEERTFWEAPEVYSAMSPFMHADKINEPILLIHGEADNNSGTFPIQSQRFYHALKGNGATVRLVLLPNESHGYRARESVLHMLWEMNEWMEKYAK
ncbi:MAG: S9 family peptidase [Bacteroidales bacterium]|nr:S9 family peptidase [Bacteroidales bacterium]